MTLAREAGSSFVSEGLQLYCEAGATLRSFHQRVYKICSDILVEHQREIKAVLGFSCTDKTLEPDAEPNGPDDDRWDDGEVTLWVQFRPVDATYFSIGVYWEQEDSGRRRVNAYAGFDFDAVAARDRLWGLVSGPGAPDMWKYGYGVYVSKPIEPAEEETFRRLLKEVLQRWLTVLQTVGGVTVLQKAVKK